MIQDQRLSVLGKQMGLPENVVSTPLYPMVLLIIIRMKNGYFIGGIHHFQTYPNESSGTEIVHQEKPTLAILKRSVAQWRAPTLLTASSTEKTKGRHLSCGNWWSPCYVNDLE